MTGLASGPGDTVIIGADGQLFTGSWVGDRLDVLPAATDSGAPLPFVIVASSPSNPLIAYASAADNAVRAMLRTVDGGTHWTTVGALDRSTAAMIVDHSSGGWSGAIAVSPFDPDVVVVGYTKGPWLSVDGGESFFPQREVSHDDKHRYRFTPSGRLWEACDGGVFYTDQLAEVRAGGADPRLHQMESRFNEHLANLQFLGPFSREFWGRTFGQPHDPGTDRWRAAGQQRRSTAFAGRPARRRRGLAFHRPGSSTDKASSSSPTERHCSATPTAATPAGMAGPAFRSPTAHPFRCATASLASTDDRGGLPAGVLHVLPEPELAQRCRRADVRRLLRRWVRAARRLARRNPRPAVQP